jgi:hypothetical protein
VYWSLSFATWANQNHDPNFVNITRAGCNAYQIHLKREIEDIDPLKRGGYVNFMVNELMRMEEFVS